MMMERKSHTPETCKRNITAVTDALYVLNGKWKLPLIVSLSDGPRRFNEIQRELKNITPKVLSKELRELEQNEFVIRKVFDTVPVSVTYELTEYSKCLDDLIEALRAFGQQHRERIIGKNQSPASDEISAQSQLVPNYMDEEEISN
jgi:DNA-binding HxlR family transcriptional regulator